MRSNRVSLPPRRGDDFERAVRAQDHRAQHRCLVLGGAGLVDDPLPRLGGVALDLQLYHRLLRYQPGWVALPLGLLELGLMLFSVVVALGGIRLAYSLYVENTAVPGRIAEKFKGAYALLLNKYYVDEIYNAVFVNGVVHKTAKFLYTIGDVKVIDGFLNGLAGAIGRTSESGRKLQTGFLQQYAFTMGLGLVVLLGLYYVLK